MGALDTLRESRARRRAHWLFRGYRLLIGGVLLFVLVVGGVGWLGQEGARLWDRSSHYQQITARVTGFGEECEVQSFPGSRRRARFSGAMDCAAAEALHARTPSDRNPSVLHFQLVQYDYVSPADGRRYQGRHRPRRWEQGLRPGDEIRVYAHLTEPALSQP